MNNAAVAHESFDPHEVADSAKMASVTKVDQRSRTVVVGVAIHEHEYQPKYAVWVNHLGVAPRSQADEAQLQAVLPEIEEEKAMTAWYSRLWTRRIDGSLWKDQKGLVAYENLFCEIDVHLIFVDHPELTVEGTPVGSQYWRRADDCSGILAHAVRRWIGKARYGAASRLVAQGHLYE